MKIKAILLSGALLAFAAASSIPTAKAADKPDFSGKWKMDVAKSDFGPIPGPTTQTNAIDHKDPSLKITTTVTGGPRGDATVDASYTTDGKESVNKQGPQEVKSTCVWDGKNLVITSKLDYQGSPLELKDTYVLADDGKSLTVNRHITITGMGELDQKLLFTKGE